MDAAKPPVAGYLESLKTPDGLYGWEGDGEAHLIVTHAVLRSYALLGLRAPGDHARMAELAVRLYR